MRADKRRMGRRRIIVGGRLESPLWKTGEPWKKTVVLLPDTGEGRQLPGGAGILDLGPHQVLGGGMLLLDHRTRIAF